VAASPSPTGQEASVRVCNVCFSAPAEPGNRGRCLECVPGAAGTGRRQHNTTFIHDDDGDSPALAKLPK
jgi:hypothetical protein